MSSLPIELVRRVVEYLDDHIGEQWLIRRKARRTWTPLRALTQVSRVWRAVAMSHLWRVVKLLPRQHDIYAVTHLRQLVEELRHPLGARNYVQHIDLTLPLRKDADKNGGREPGKEGGPYSIQEQLVFVHDCLNGVKPADVVYRSKPDTIATLARILTGQFIDCPQLQTLKWTGWLEPDMVLLENLSRCQRLTKLSVDLGAVSFLDTSRVRTSADAVAIERPPKHECFPALQTLEFALIQRYPEMYDHHSHIPMVYDQQGRDYVETLLEYKAIPKHFKLGVDHLLDEAWMAPVWATIDYLSWWFKDILSAEHPPRHRFYYRKYKRPLAEAKGLSQFLMTHINFFEPAAQGSGSSGSKQRDVAVIARDIYNLIQTRDELKHHREMYEEWSDAIPDAPAPDDQAPDDRPLHTKTEMIKLAQILLAKVAAKAVL